MDKAKIITKVDIKKTLLSIPMGHDVWLPLNGFSVNSVRSTATRLNAESIHGHFSIKEDYTNKVILISRN